MLYLAAIVTILIGSSFTYSFTENYKKKTEDDGEVCETIVKKFL